MMRCPRCQAHDLDPSAYDPAGMVTCACGHRAYAGFLSEADALAARSAWLADRIRAGDPAPPTELSTAYRVWPPPAHGPLPAQPAGELAPDRTGSPELAHPYPTTGRHSPAPSAQTLLLGIGALLLVVAGAVFAAVVWDRLGAAGQVLLMLGATLGVGTLAVRLRSRLAGTAQALAVVAAGLAAIDLIAAPLLGLLPEHWVTTPTLYPAVALGCLGLCLLALSARFRLGAWSWLGWAALLAGAACVVAAAGGAGASGAVVAAAVSVPALASVAMIAAPALTSRPSRLDPHRLPMEVLGTGGFLLAALGTASAALDHASLPGALLTTGVTAAAVTAWSAMDRRPMVEVLSAALLGITVGLALGLAPVHQPTWMAAVAAVAGLAMGLALAAWRRALAPAVVAAAGVWLAWAVLRVAALGQGAEGSEVSTQLSLLLGLIAVMALVLAWRAPWAGWIGALLGFAALMLAPFDTPDALEWYSLPAAVLLLVAGLLWRRPRPDCPSLQWLGPAVAVALIPSALATWAAPWALGSSSAGVGPHLVRLVLVLSASVLAVVVGARRNLAGLLLPAATALLIAAGAQVGSGLSALPRWQALGLAGTLLIVAGARIEWLRREGRRAVGWVEALR